MKQRLIFHLDMDQFFAAVEIRSQPWLRGKPVIVGGDPVKGRGIVVTASYEARRYGVRSGMPTIEAVRLCPHGEFVRSDPGKYVDASQRVFQILREYTDLVEPVSVDEAYIEVTDLIWHWPDVESLARHIKGQIRERLQLSSSIGAGANRVVAKIASGIQKPDGFSWLPPERVPVVFATLPVGDLIGVGKSTQRVLEGFGIRTAGDLARFPLDVLTRRFGKFGEDLHNIANGIGNNIVLAPDEHPQEKSMGHEHSLSSDQVEAEVILGWLHRLCEKTARRLRRANLAGRVVTIKLRYHGFETVFHGHRLKHLVQHEWDIYSSAETLFHECWRKGEAVRLIGVHVADLARTDCILQQELFVDPAKPSQLSMACDEIKERYGESSIGFASGAFSGGEPPSSPRNRRRLHYFNPFNARELILGSDEG